MDLLEFMVSSVLIYIICCVSFIVIAIHTSFSYRKLTSEQKGVLLEVPESVRWQRRLFIIFLIIYNVLLFWLGFIPELDRWSKPIKLHPILPIGLLIISVIGIFVERSIFKTVEGICFQHKFPKEFIRFRNNYINALTICISIAIAIFLIGWVLFSRINLDSILNSL